VHYSGPAGDVFLIGVAHLSNRSAQLVRDAVRSVSPDLVMVELDSTRLQKASKNNSQIMSAQVRSELPPLSSFARSSSPDMVAEERKALSPASQSGAGGFMLVELRPVSGTSTVAPDAAVDANTEPWQWATKAMSGAAKDLGVRALKGVLDSVYKAAEGYTDRSAGSELVAAIKEAARADVPVLLGDQTLQQTLRRISAELGKTDFKRLSEELEAASDGQFGFQSSGGLLELLEKAKNQAMSQKLRGALKASAPGLFSAFVDERDAVMADNLLKSLAAGRKRVVAVVGSIHVAGIGERLAENRALSMIDACVY